MITLYKTPTQSKNLPQVTTWKGINSFSHPPLNRLVWLTDGSSTWIGKAVRIDSNLTKIGYTHTDNKVWVNSTGDWCSDYHVPSTEHNPVAWQDLPLPFTTRYLPEISR